MTQTPEFQGTHLFDRLCWAKENLEPVQSDYRVVYEDDVDGCAKVLVPDPNFCAAFLAGGILSGCIGNWQMMRPSQILNGTHAVTCCTKHSQLKLAQWNSASNT